MMTNLITIFSINGVHINIVERFPRAGALDTDYVLKRIRVIGFSKVIIQSCDIIILPRGHDCSISI